jgi:UDP-N-acetylmuramoylalanine-D-glutamate ligase
VSLQVSSTNGSITASITDELAATIAISAASIKSTLSNFEGTAAPTLLTGNVRPVHVCNDSTGTAATAASQRGSGKINLQAARDQRLQGFDTTAYYSEGQHAVASITLQAVKGSVHLSTANWMDIIRRRHLGA